MYVTILASNFDYKYLEIPFLNIEFNISHEGKELLAQTSSLIKVVSVDQLCKGC